MWRRLTCKCLQVCKQNSFLLYLFTALSSPAIAGDTLTPGQHIADDGATSLVSAGGSFALGFFSPAGSSNRYVGVWYHNISVQTVVWVANRKTPVAGSHGSLSIMANGTLVVTDENSTIVWSSRSRLALANPVAQLLDSGNLVVREAASDANDPNSYAWQGFDFPTDTILSGMKLGWNLTTMFDRRLSSWASASDPAPGVFTLGIDLHGDPQIYEWAGERPVWRAGPWNGLSFTGVPQLKPNHKTSLQFPVHALQFVVDARQVVFELSMLDPAIVSRGVVNHTGTLQLLVWVADREYWYEIRNSPMDQCDVMSPCGPNGVCDTSEFPVCSCLPGFEPKNPSNWGMRVGTDGCVRRTRLDCRNGTDGFVQVSGTKLPDTASATVDWSVSTSLEQCRDECWKNCSCTAYAQANISGSGSGCILWSTNLTDLRLYESGGQDLYVRLAAADLGSESNHHHRGNVVVLTIVPLFALVILLLAAVAYFVRKTKRRKRTDMPLGAIIFRSEHHTNERAETKDLDLPLFDLNTIIDATDNFSIDNKLGEGGFGPVYKGKLRGDQEQEIAVKRQSKNSAQGFDEFKNEVIVVAKLQHKNLVRLLGCCIHGEERMLIYEYMPNKSLDSFLFGLYILYIVPLYSK